jgi:hypothetical protein
VSQSTEGINGEEDNVINDNAANHNISFLLKKILVLIYSGILVLIQRYVNETVPHVQSVPLPAARPGSIQ